VNILVNIFVNIFGRFFLQNVVKAKLSRKQLCNVFLSWITFKFTKPVKKGRRPSLVLGTGFMLSDSFGTQASQNKICDDNLSQM